MNPTSPHLNQPQPQSGHTFSAKEKDDETGYSYTSTSSVRRFGARYGACPDERGNSVPIAIGIRVWLSVDPMVSEYPSMSPFMYCAGNPVMLIDPDGRYFTGNTLLVKTVYSIISKLAVLGFDRAILFKNKLEKMDESDVEFYIGCTFKRDAIDGKGGSTSFNFDKNRVELDIFSFFNSNDHPVSKEARAAHELEHGFQFLVGQLSFRDDKAEPSFYDKTDEEKAYQIQNLITNYQIRPGEKMKTDEDAKNAASYPYNSVESTINSEAAEIYRKIGSRKRYMSIYNYKPNQEQIKAKKSILNTPNNE